MNMIFQTMGKPLNMFSILINQYICYIRNKREKISDSSVITLFLIIVATGCSLNQPPSPAEDPLKRQIVGSWFYRNNAAAQHITFHEDNSYEEIDTEYIYGERYTFFGTYQTRNDSILISSYYYMALSVILFDVEVAENELQCAQKLLTKPSQPTVRLTLTRKE